MGKFTVSADVFEKLPGYCLGVVVAEGFDNASRNEFITKMMEDEEALFAERMQGINLKEYPGIMVYRDAFKAVGLNPNKFMCSIEALSKRVQKGNKLPNINTLVDMGNAMSLKYLLPMGAHDINKMNNAQIAVRFSTTADSFQPMGEDAKEAMPDGELVYVSEHTVKTRRWTWRQSDDGKIDETTSYVFFPIDGFKGTNEENVVKAREELASMLTEKFGCKVKTGWVDKDNREFEF